MSAPRKDLASSGLRLCSASFMPWRTWLRTQPARAEGKADQDEQTTDNKTEHKEK